ncbi:hypothetical protein V7O66_13740 [Methanolobus sp. ZRKC3]|uniref:hypothetical protein n=1 Tax=Methanolobus sp. ZRKC3 TaxID=3125786 RepID=UPI0032506412
MPTTIEIPDTQGDTGPTEVEVLTSQLQIAEAKIIELKALNKGLSAENDELRTLINDNAQAQQILATAAAAISDEIDEKQTAIVDIPEGLSHKEVAVLKDARQAEIDELVTKQEKLKVYIRGEI